MIFIIVIYYYNFIIRSTLKTTVHLLKHYTRFMSMWLMYQMSESTSVPAFVVFLRAKGLAI